MRLKRNRLDVQMILKKFPKAKSIFIDLENYLEFEKNPQKFIVNYSV